MREDRRHIKDDDVVLLKQSIKSKLNLEIAAVDEMLEFALEVKPDYVCFVPENREEKTTEGGLNLQKNFNTLCAYIKQLHANNIKVSLFIAPNNDDILAAYELGSYAIELHTGEYALNKTHYLENADYHNIVNACKYAHTLGLCVNAGHGLDYENVSAIARISQISELNIGFAIIARSILMGLPLAVSTMKKLILFR